DLGAKYDHVLEVRWRQLEPREEPRDVVRLEIHRLAGIGLIQYRLDEALGNRVPQGSCACPDVNPPGSGPVDEHCLAGMAKVDPITVASVVDLPNTGRRIWMEQQIHLRGRFVAVLWDVEPVDVVAVPASETGVEIGKKRIE